MKTSMQKIWWLCHITIITVFLFSYGTANETELGTTTGDCYYNYNHYSEGDRILTNEPCLNCTCHNKMLMCYLKVCPFTKPIGQDCTIEKREDQCCPIITCPEVPVALDQSVTQSTTDMAMHQQFGCTIDEHFYPEGAQIPGNPKKPCELCYCIRNMTSCVMQECTLHVDGCRPIYNKGVCCPVRYDCSHDEILIEDNQITTEPPSQGFVITTTSAPSPSTECLHNNIRYIDGELIETDQPCEHCYCMRGDIVCAVQECGKPLEVHGKNCTARQPTGRECCPQIYECESDTESSTLSQGAFENYITTQQVFESTEKVEEFGTTIKPIDFITERIDESENEIHDKDYDHLTVKPPRNITLQQSSGANDYRINSESSSTLLNKLEEYVTSTISSTLNILNQDEAVTTILPLINNIQITTEDSSAKEKNDVYSNTEKKHISSEAFTTVQPVVELTTDSVQENGHDYHKMSNTYDGSLLSNVIPGEGDCLDDGITYNNNTNVPVRNICQRSCICFNSIVHCEDVQCEPSPPNCEIIHKKNECCPSYYCIGTTESNLGYDDTTLLEKVEYNTESYDAQPTDKNSIETTTHLIDQPATLNKLDDSDEIKPEFSTTASSKEHTPAQDVSIDSEKSITEINQEAVTSETLKIDEKEVSTPKLDFFENKFEIETVQGGHGLESENNADNETVFSTTPSLESKITVKYQEYETTTKKRIENDEVTVMQSLEYNPNIDFSGTGDQITINPMPEFVTFKEESVSETTPTPNYQENNEAIIHLENSMENEIKYTTTQEKTSTEHQHITQNMQVNDEISKKDEELNLSTEVPNENISKQDQNQKQDSEVETSIAFTTKYPQILNDNEKTNESTPPPIAIERDESITQSYNQELPFRQSGMISSTEHLEISTADFEERITTHASKYQDLTEKNVMSTESNDILVEDVNQQSEKEHMEYIEKDKPIYLTTGNPIEKITTYSQDTHTDSTENGVIKSKEEETSMNNTNFENEENIAENVDIIKHDDSEIMATTQGKLEVVDYKNELEEQFTTSAPKLTPAVEQTFQLQNKPESESVTEKEYMEHTSVHGDFYTTNLNSEPTKSMIDNTKQNANEGVFISQQKEEQTTANMELNNLNEIVKHSTETIIEYKLPTTQELELQSQDVESSDNMQTSETTESVPDSSTNVQSLAQNPTQISPITFTQNIVNTDLIEEQEIQQTEFTTVDTVHQYPTENVRGEPMVSTMYPPTSFSTESNKYDLITVLNMINDTKIETTSFAVNDETNEKEKISKPEWVEEQTEQSIQSEHEEMHSEKITTDRQATQLPEILTEETTIINKNVQVTTDIKFGLEPTTEVISKQTVQYEMEKINYDKNNEQAANNSQAQESLELTTFMNGFESSTFKSIENDLITELPVTDNIQESNFASSTMPSEIMATIRPNKPLNEQTTTSDLLANTEEEFSSKPTILQATTIKNVVELLTTLYPNLQTEETTPMQAFEPNQATQNTSNINENDIYSVSSTPLTNMFISQNSHLEQSMYKENNTEDSLQMNSLPESANKIPLIRDPLPDRFGDISTKLAENFDTTTLPSNLFSHTEQISYSTTDKNDQHENTKPLVSTDGTLSENDQEIEHQPQSPTYMQTQGPSYDQSGYGNVPSQYPDEEYTDEDEPTVFGPGTCRYGGKLYVSAQQIPRDDPCDFCFCFRSDIICLQQSCPPPINGCHEEPIQGFCCPRYECPVSMGLILNATTTTTTTLPPYLSHFQRNTSKVTRSGCQIQGITYKIGERVTTASGPCIDCICGGDGQMKCDPKVCTPEPMLRQMIAVAAKRR